MFFLYLRLFIINDLMEATLTYDNYEQFVQDIKRAVSFLFLALHSMISFTIPLISNGNTYTNAKNPAQIHFHSNNKNTCYHKIE